MSFYLSCCRNIFFTIQLQQQKRTQHLHNNIPYLPSHILQPFADGHHFIGRNATMVDAHGIMVKNAMLINGDYHRMHASIQSLVIDMFKKAKIWAIREPQNMFHGLVPAGVLQQYCDQHSIKEFIIPDIMTYDHPHREVWTGDTAKTNF